MIRYCAHCGGSLPTSPPVQCAEPHCRVWTYDNSKPSGSAVIVRADQFLAVRRAQAPAIGRWDLPGGFCDAGEHPADAAVRETREETNLRIHLGPLVGLYLGTYAWQGDTYSTLNAYYVAHLDDPEAEPHRSAETTETAWFPIHAAPRLAFEHQDAMIIDAAQLLRAKHEKRSAPSILHSQERGFDA